MKSTHITTVHPPLDVRIFHKECSILIKNGYDISIIAQNDISKVVDGVRIISLPVTKNRLKRMFILTLIALWKAVKENSDLYHIHDPELIIIGYLLKIITGKRIIYDIHEDCYKDILTKHYLPAFCRTIVAKVTRMIEDIFIKKYDGIITATDAIYENFKYHGMIISLRNFPELNENEREVRTTKSDIDLELDRNAGFFNIIYSGGLEEIRGISNIVDAMEMIKDGDVRLILCGKYYPEDYEEHVKRKKGYEKVHFLGWVSRDQLAKVYRIASVGLVCFLPAPNHVDALPNKLFEYMAAGIPIIASKFPLWRSIVEGNRCGICVEPESPKEIADAIAFLKSNPREAQQMGVRGRRIVETEYNWNRESRKLLQFYRRFLEPEKLAP
jgi:glycosyltransferase involved in cell wall biosynthesis